jgi:hypothetical protein
VFEARSFHSFKLTYTTGRYGLDDTGSIKIVLRFTADGGDLQVDDPSAANYVSAIASNGTALQLSFDSNGHARPWFQSLTVTVRKGYLREGDTIEIIIGDKTMGSPGYILQSMCESAFTFRVLVDACATGHFVPVAESPAINIGPGSPSVWKAIIPTLKRPGEVFRLGIKAEDLYGNPSNQVDENLSIDATGEIEGLPGVVSFKPGARAVVIDGLSITDEGNYKITIRRDDGTVLAHSNPIEISSGKQSSWWADMHGQSGESVGINTAREYFSFARDLAFLDATSHQANDFQINSAFWNHINELTAEFHEDHRFLTLPGYEWSGNTGVGGDRNVYFRNEGRQIRRSSHALIEDRSEILTDASNARDLFDVLQNEDCLVYAHIGGRPADVAYAHDARLETAMEIHSAWGSFEWLMGDCFEQGYRVGVVANSDGHKGRPGASYPGTSEFGAYGGLTCFLMDQLTRDDLFDCLRHRRHYATTGERIHVEFEVKSDTGFERFDIDPIVGDGPSKQVSSLSMGDIAKTSSKTATASFSVQSAKAIERIDVFNAMDIVKTIRNPASIKKQGRIRVLWRGAMVKGRGARATWNGRVTFNSCKILKTQQINAWNPDRILTQDGPNTLTWDSFTAGNFGAFDVWLEESEDASLLLESNLITSQLSLADIGHEDHIIDAGGLDLEVRIFRLADELTTGPLTGEINVSVNPDRDTPLWIRATTEDGFQAWTSPVYLFK